MTLNSLNFVYAVISQSFLILIIMDFGDNMMLMRKKKKLSQAALGKLIGTSGDVIGRYERGDIKPSIDVVAKIADALEVSVDYLIGKTNLILDKETIHRIEDISNLKEENKNFIFNLIDMALRDMKTKKAYS
ncbi:MAG TPA: helix-turn-helix transcriptional regulator [Aequorivita sp.]|nr:helix-turn-helix transcriptional regulator [Aequorivita sp.]